MSNNVNQCAKSLEKYTATGDDTTIKIIDKIPDDNRVNILKNKTLQELTTSLHKLRCSFFDVIENFYNIKIKHIIQSSSDNKKSADIIIELLNKKFVDIELKFGNETNANIGLRTFNSLIDNEQCKFKYLKSNERIKYAKYLYDKILSLDDWLRYRNKFLNEYIETFNSLLGNKELTNESSKILFDKIINKSGSANFTSENEYLKLIIKSDCTFSIGNDLPKEKVYFKNIHYIDEENKRMNIFISNGEKNIYKMILNWKNSYKKFGVKFDAKYGFGCPSFNCFKLV